MAQQQSFAGSRTSHDRTVSLAVSPADSSLVAVTGWASVLDNEGDERVFMSTDAGATWNDVTANLAAATATVGKVRPSALVRSCTQMNLTFTPAG